MSSSETHTQWNPPQYIWVWQTERRSDYIQVSLSYMSSVPSKVFCYFLVPVWQIQPWCIHLQKAFSTWQRMPEPFYFAVKALILMRKTITSQKRQAIGRELFALNCNFITNRLRTQWLLRQSSKLNSWSCVA